MKLTITSHNKDGYLLIESKGTLQTRDELIEHSQLLFDEIVEQGAKKVIVDDRGTHFPMELFPYFGLVQDYAVSYPPEIRSLIIGIVVAPEYKEVAESWESLCLTRGLQFYAFTSLEEATGWLLETM